MERRVACAIRSGKIVLSKEEHARAQKLFEKGLLTRNEVDRQLGKLSAWKPWLVYRTTVIEAEAKSIAILEREKVGGTRYDNIGTDEPYYDIFDPYGDYWKAFKVEIIEGDELWYWKIQVV